MAVELDEQALVKKRRPVGWFVAGLVTIAAAASAAGFVLPLHTAHERLLEEYEALARKSQELDHALVQTREQLEQTEARKMELTRFLKEGADAEAELRGQFGVASSTIERELEPFIKAKLARVETGIDAIDVHLADRAVFSPRSTNVPGRAAKPLCAAVAPLLQRDGWNSTVTLFANVEEDDAWAHAAERAAHVAETIVQRCELDPARVQGRLRLTAREDDPEFPVVVVLAPQESVLLRASEAPPETSSGTEGPKDADSSSAPSEADAP